MMKCHIIFLDNALENALQRIFLSFFSSSKKKNLQTRRELNFHVDNGAPSEQRADEMR